MRKVITTLGIVVGITIISIFIVFQNQDTSITNEDKTTLSGDVYFEILEYSVNQLDNSLILSIMVPDSIPVDISMINTAGSNLGFGYVWLWDDSEILEHHGLGHLTGYTAIIQRDYLFDTWYVESVDVETVFEEGFNVDFCFSNVEDLGVVTLNDNKIDVQIPLRYVDILEKELKNVISFNLESDPICHSGFGGKIIHKIDL